MIMSRPQVLTDDNAFRSATSRGRNPLRAVRQTETVVRRMPEVVAAAEGANDVVTADLLTGFVARHEKDA